MRELVEKFMDLHSSWGECPFCKAAGDTFHVSEDEFHCYACGSGGNKIELLHRLKNIPYKMAQAELSGETLKPDSGLLKHREMLLQLNKDAGNYYFCALRKSDPSSDVMKYVRKRNIDKQTIKQFAIGYAGGGLYQHLKEKGYTDDILIKSGLCIYDEKKNHIKDRFWNRLMFPILNKDRIPVGFGGRALGDAKPKYLNSPESAIFHKRQNLFGIDRASRSNADGLLLCEGYMDVVSLHQAGFDNAVATLGTAITADHAKHIRQFTSKVYICYDMDEAGVNAAVKAVKILSSHGVETSVVKMPGSKDPDEFIQANGREAFAKQIESADPGIKFLYDASRSEVPETHKEKQIDLLNFLLLLS